MRENVERAMERLASFVAGAGAGLELVSVDEAAGCVEIRFTGGCGGCATTALHVQEEVERELRAVPGVKTVLQVL